MSSHSHFSNFVRAHCLFVETVFDETECRHLLRVAIANHKKRVGRQGDKSTNSFKERIFDVLNSSFKAYKKFHLCQRMKILEIARFELILNEFGAQEERELSIRRFSSMSQLPSQMLKLATANNRKAAKEEERSLRGKALATENLAADLAEVKKQLADLTAAIRQGQIAGSGDTE